VYVCVFLSSVEGLIPHPRSYSKCVKKFNVSKIMLNREKPEERNHEHIAFEMHLDLRVKWQSILSNLHLSVSASLRHSEDFYVPSQRQSPQLTAASMNRGVCSVLPPTSEAVIE
jgi:hypothetical protein